MKKHILFIVENNGVPSDVRVWNEACSARDFGFHVSVICPRTSSKQKKNEILEGIHIHRHFFLVEASGKIGFIFEYLNALIWELLLSIHIFIKKPFHAIHAANPPDHIFLISLVFKLFGVKFIFDHHDICPENYVAKFGRKDLFHKLLMIMERLTFKSADIVISTNNSYKKIALGRGKKKEKDVFVVRNGPDLNRISFPEPNPRWKSGRRFLVAYLGEINSQEGLDALIRAVHYIVYKMNNHDIHFVVMGNGPHLKILRQMSQKLGIENFVRFTGYVPYSDLYEVLSTADLCVNPEFRNEFTDKSTMIKIMDYMSFGCPIVQFYTIEGKVTAEDAAVYVTKNCIKEFAKAIVELLNNPKKRFDMSKKAHQRINAALKWDIQKEQLKRAYNAAFDHIH